MYINCHSQYSFKYGTMQTSDLLDESEKLGVQQLALTDINSTSGSLYFAMEAKKRGINPCLGVDFRVGNKQKFIAIAQNNLGFENINLYLSSILESRAILDSKAPSDLLQHAFIIYPLEKAPRQLQPKEFVGIRPHQLFVYQKMEYLWPKQKCLALNTVSFGNKRDFNTHRLLRAIDCNTLLSKLANEEQGKIEHRFYSQTELQRHYKSHTHLLENTTRLLQNCQLNFDFDGKSQNMATFSQSEEDDFALLKHLAYEGIAYRFGENPSKKMVQRMEKELGIIQNCGFVPYFLANYTIVKYAQHKGYFYVGRGSGANSLIAYLLRITNVDPLELDLYFERFINPSRQSPPDFDIDFSWRDREDITQYIFKTFPNTALLGSFVTFQQRSVVREIGKVLGLPDEEIRKVQQRNYHQLDTLQKLCWQYSRYIHGLPDHLSVHSSGIIITEKKIQYFGATSLPPKGFPTSHFDMHIAEDVGIYKYDILGQRGLSKIKETLSIIKQNKPNKPGFNIENIKEMKQDKNIKKLLENGDSIGCFYIESPAMRGLMKKLKVNDFTGLVAASSIIRPGVSKSGMMTEYIKRHRNPKLRKAAHPILAKILHETYGVMVYQEDVLKVAHHFAGLSLEESDVLRRGMSWKYKQRSEFAMVKQKFFANCKKKGYTIELSTEIWTQIESFANYAFAKGHSASYAVESYQSLFLKAYYPLEYMVATINNFGGFYRTEQYIQEARLKGAKILRPCVNTSQYETTIKSQNIFLGFQHIKALEKQLMQNILQNRKINGPFRSLEDFVYRLGPSLEMTLILIRTGAFRFTKQHKTYLLWQAHFLLEKKKNAKRQTGLFETPIMQGDFQIPQLDPHPKQEALDDIEYLGFPLCSPFELLEKEEQKNCHLSSVNFKEKVGKKIEIVAYLVHTKKTYTQGQKKEEMGFGTFMDIEGHFFDTVHFPNTYKKNDFMWNQCYRIKGKVIEQFDYLSLEAHSIKRLVYKELQRPEKAY
ncbi:MAG: hypothetical protein CBB99_02960 [Bacteroidetes bacterium TMED39]|nr:MAG: hypothetical protein CBB99_02960 [Bacteroidetes bacterium TMED39]